jgi:anti-sigma B factor antagonist
MAIPPLQPKKPGGNIPPISTSSGARPKPKMQTTVQGDNIAVVSILESRILDESNIVDIGNELMDLVKKRYMIKMVLDMGEVKYLSSAVLRQLIAVYKAIKAENGDLKLCRVHPEVREVFKITQLDKMIEIKDDLDSAINSFKLKKGGWGFLTR